MDGSTAPLKFDQVEYKTSFEPPAAKKASNNRRRRRFLLGALGAVVLVAGVGYGAYWFFVARHYETTNDAYLGADSVTIAPKVGGYVAELKVADNQVVHKGDVLARIDPRDYETAVESASADRETPRRPQRTSTRN